MNRSAIALIIIIIVIIGIIVAVSYSNSQPAYQPSPDQGLNQGINQQSSSTNSSSTTTFGSTSTTTSTGTGRTISQSSKNYKVVYTDSGFSPANLTIRKGDSVTWTDNSSGNMWVASDPHPTHTNLPGFDESTFAEPGQSYTYTFTVPGAHGYHNHANPGMRGVITVQ
jgi:plastocyanin